MLSERRIIEAAAAVADASGLRAVSMRSVAKELGVEAMSLYHHVASKDALLDALVDWVFEQIATPGVEDPWREAMVQRSRSARAVLSQHPWALGMLESRPTPGRPLLVHHDRVLGCLMSSGFTATLATHAFSVLDAYVYGFALTEASLPFPPGDGAEEAFATHVAAPPDEYPHIARTFQEVVKDRDYSFAAEFDYGLDLILDGVEHRLNDTAGDRHRHS